MGNEYTELCNVMSKPAKPWSLQLVFKELNEITLEEIEELKDNMPPQSDGEEFLDLPISEDALRVFALSERYTNQRCVLSTEIAEITQQSYEALDIFESLILDPESIPEAKKSLLRETISELHELNAQLEESVAKDNLLTDLAWILVKDTVGRNHDELSLRRGGRLVRQSTASSVAFIKVSPDEPEFGDETFSENIDIFSSKD